MHETPARTLGWEDPLGKSPWQTTPVFFSGESRGLRNLVGYSPRGHKESDTTEQLALLPQMKRKEVRNQQRMERYGNQPGSLKL